jgi:hypothetical protein
MKDVLGKWIRPSSDGLPSRLGRTALPTRELGITNL